MVGEELRDVQRESSAGAGGHDLGVRVEEPRAESGRVLLHAPVHPHVVSHCRQLLIAPPAHRPGEVAQEHHRGLRGPAAIDVGEGDVIGPKRQVDARRPADLLFVEREHAGVAAVQHQVVVLGGRPVGQPVEHRVVREPRRQLSARGPQRREHRRGSGGRTEHQDPVRAERADAFQMRSRDAEDSLRVGDVDAAAETPGRVDLVPGRDERALEGGGDVSLLDGVEEHDSHGTAHSIRAP